MCFGARVFGINKKNLVSASPHILFYSFLLCTLLFESLLACLLYCFYDHSVVQFGTAWYGTVLCVYVCECVRDRQGSSVGDVAGQGRG